MSEDRPVYIRCASGSNAHTDCVVRSFGDLVEILGHPMMQFTSEDAVHFATALLVAADKSSGRVPGADHLRSRIAMALHAPVMPDNLSRPLLVESSEALATQNRYIDYWMKSGEHWRLLYLQEAVLRDAEIDDGR